MCQRNELVGAGQREEKVVPALSTAVSVALWCLATKRKKSQGALVW